MRVKSSLTMTIIAGPEDQKSVPPSLPPTYAEVTATRPQQAQRGSQSPVTSPYPVQLPLPQPASQHRHETMPGPPPLRAYGPTPLAASQSAMMPVLPYYDPRSPWAMEVATSRARRRFFGALLWGFVIWLAIGSLVGGVVGDARRPRQGGSWAVE